MSLQVWLPLNGTLENKGLSDVTVTNNGAVVNTSGKIGSCYTGTTTSQTIVVTLPGLSNMLVNGKCYSLACWVKVVGTATNGWCVKLGTNSCGLWWAKSEARWVWNENDNGKRCANPTVSGDTSNWYHLVNVVDKTDPSAVVVEHYVNGEPAEGYDSHTIDMSSLTQPAGDIITVTPYIANVNDLRIYDHCLSQKEVKELSKGLIGHWLLNDGVGGENLQPGSHDFTKWGMSANAVKHDGYVTLNGTTANWTAAVHSAKMETSLLDGTTIYTWSFEYRCNDSWSMLGVIGGSSLTTSQSGNTRTKFSNWQSLTTVVSSEGIWKRFVFTSRTIAVSQLTSGSGDVNSWFLQLYNRTDDISVDIRNFKLEKGSVTTPWTPNPADTEYSAMGLDDGVIYDCSGYGRNGSVSANPPTVDVDTPRYSVCNKFNGSNNFVILGRDAMVKDEITVNAWAYMSDWSTYNGMIISCTEGGGWNFGPSSGKISFAIGTGASSNTYKSAISTTTILTTLSSGWHMFTGTYDGLASKVYVDAVLQGTNSAYTTKTPIFYNASNGIFIGAEAAGNQTTPAGNYFNGKLSDVRIYATALSADDIKELYETAASVDNYGNFWGYELSET